MRRFPVRSVMRRAVPVMLLATVLSVPAGAAQAATGGLDATFGSKGLTNVVGADDLFLAADGRIWVSGANGAPAGEQGGYRTRLAANGRPDSSYSDAGGPGAEFMTGGEGVVTSAGGSLTAWNGCCGGPPPGVTTTLRYVTAAGRAASFGAFVGGFLRTPQPSPNGLPPFDQFAGGIVRLADGRFRVCLSQTYEGDAPNDVVLWGIKADGTPDTTVGPNGFRQIPGLQSCGTGPAARTSSPLNRGLFLDKSGRLYVIGTGDGSTRVVRTNASGAVDTTYGQGGTFTLTYPGRAFTPGDAEITQGGTLFLGTTSQDGGAQPAATIAKVTASGVLDVSFGSGGFKRFTVAGGSVTLDSLGTLQNNRLALAMTYTVGGQRAGKLTAVSATTAQPDRTFGSNGSVSTGLLVSDTLLQGATGLILSGKLMPANPGSALGQSVVERRVV